jgi:hypothetical protein
LRGRMAGRQSDDRGADCHLEQLATSSYEGQSAFGCYDFVVGHVAGKSTPNRQV